MSSGNFLLERGDTVADTMPHFATANARRLPERGLIMKSNAIKGLLAAAAITAVALSATGCEMPEDSGTTHAEEVVKEKAAASDALGKDKKAKDKKDKPADKMAEATAEKPEPNYTTSQENAIASAYDYLDYSAFSKAGLIDQLSSKYGDGFSKADAAFAVNHIKVNWNEQAAASALEYLDYDSFSRSGLIQQLESEYGEQFTHAQAVYGVNQTGL